MTSRVSYSTNIEATPEQVWTIISDVTRLPEWAYKEGRFPYPVEGKYGSEQTQGVGTIWIGVATDGQIATQKITTWEPGQKLVYELQETENAPLKMAQANTLTLKPNGHTTTVTWSVDWKLTGGFSLNSILIWFTGNGAFEEMIAGSLENLKVMLEQDVGQTDTASSQINDADRSAGDAGE